MSEQLFQVGVKALVRDDQGRVLLVRETTHQSIYWDIAGGRMEPGEQLESALLRELSEEVGVQSIAAASQLTTVLSNKQVPTNHGNVALLLVVYEVKLNDGQRISPGELGLETAWQSPTEAAKLLADKYPGQFCEQVSGLV
jgi:8-oxo-dGTP diphosphatase